MEADLCLKERHKDRNRNMNNQNFGYSWRNNMRGPMNNPFGITLSSFYLCLVAILI